MDTVLVINLNENWQVDTKNNVIGLRDDLSWWQKQKLFWFRRTEVRRLYRDVQAWLASEEGMVFPDVMWHGNFKSTDEIKNKIDTVLQMKEAWSIRDDSLRALTRGPLLNPDGTKILVPSHGLLTAAVLWIEGRPLYRFIAILATLIGLVAIFI